MLTPEEFGLFLRSLKLNLSEQEVLEFQQASDLNADGFIVSPSPRAGYNPGLASGRSSGVD
jgi:hypothetical protein